MSSFSFALCYQPARSHRSQAGGADVNFAVEPGANSLLGSISCHHLQSDSVALALPRGANGELGLASGGGAKNLTAVSLAADRGLGVREDCRDILAFVALNIQEVGVWSLNQSLKFVHVFLM